MPGNAGATERAVTERGRSHPEGDRPHYRSRARKSGSSGSGGRKAPHAAPTRAKTRTPIPSTDARDQSYRLQDDLTEAQKEMIDFLIDMAIEEWLQNH
jgi:hypothetical protein